MTGKKRGVSAVVATVLIILITVAAVGIVWAGVLSMINDKIDEDNFCLEVMGQISIRSERQYTCWNNVSGFENISLGISRGSKSFNLADIQVLVSTRGDATSFNLVDSATTLSPIDVTFADLPEVNGAKVFVVDVSGISGDIEEVRIAPIVFIDGSMEVCGISSTIKIQEC